MNIGSGSNYYLASMLIALEVDRANNLHGPILNGHHAWGVIEEELEEFKDEVRANNHRDMLKECVQLGAMALKTLMCLASQEELRDMLCAAMAKQKEMEELRNNEAKPAISKLNRRPVVGGVEIEKVA